MTQLVSLHSVTTTPCSKHSIVADYHPPHIAVSGTSLHVSALQSPVLLLMKIWPRDAPTWILGTSGACQSRIRWTTWLGRCGTLFTAHSSTTNSV
uniref:Uncharacterized protein n=1 Tax=Aegilops tauschii subsp. strangulata TaxID=200361 RepID=A0A452YJD8_AEGTS